MGVLLVLGTIFLLLFCILGVAAIFRLVSFPPRPRRQEKTDTENLCVQDPNCGRFLAREDALTESFDGRKLFFCSPSCQRQYERRQKLQHAVHNSRLYLHKSVKQQKIDQGRHGRH